MSVGFRPLAMVALTIPMLAGSILAQEPSDRPRIGLVLSGGGARGIAHVGAIAALEEMRVPVDVVTGTSMGALIGGLYAAGLTADSIGAILSSVDWEELLADTPVRASIDFPQRARQHRYTMGLEAGFSDDGLILPSGFVSGQELGLLLRRATFPVASVDDFDRLPIPFATVATDIRAFERVVLDHGDLVEAMRASMTIPVAVAPIEIDGRLLVDGGLVDDLPVQLAREMGADIVIAIDVTPPLLEAEQIRDLIGIGRQAARGLARHEVDDSRASADVGIVPDLEGIGVFDFRRSTEILARGKRAVLAVADSLAPWVLLPEAYASHRAARDRRRPGPPDRIAGVRLAAPGIDPRLAQARIGPSTSHDFDPMIAERLARRMYATGLFERVGWDLEPVESGTGLVIDADVPSYGPHMLLGGIDLLLDSAGERSPRLSFQSVIGYVRNRIGARAAEWRLDLRVGTTTGLETAYRMPLDFAGRWFVEPSALVTRAEHPVFLDAGPDAEYETRSVLAGIDVGRTVGSSAEIRIGIRSGRESSELEPATVGSGVRFPREAETVGEIRGSLVVDRLDAVGIPRRGVYAGLIGRASRRGLGADREWAIGMVDARLYGSRGSHTLFARAEAGGSTPSRGQPARDEFLLGGFGSLTGSADDEHRGEAFAVARVGWLVRVAELPPAFSAVVAGGWVEAGDAWDPSLDENPDAKTAISAALGLESLLGPVFLAWTYDRDGGRLALAIGRSP